MHFGIKLEIFAVMKRYVLLIILLGCFATTVSAQKNITIKGTTVNGAGKRIELFTYADQLSNSEVLLDSVTIGPDQAFKLQCFAKYPMQVYLQIENYSQMFYVEPGRDYELYIRRFDWNIDETKNVFLSPEALPLEFVNLPKNDLNALIDHFDIVVASFIKKNIYHLDQRFKPQKQYFDSLMLLVEKTCPDTENDYFNRYKRYTLAELKFKLHFDSRKNLVNEHIKNQPVLYYDENYMALFNTLYSDFVSKGLKQVKVSRMAHWIYNLDLDTYIDSIGTDPLLRNEQIRELAALIALKESFYDQKHYDPEMSAKMIQRLADRTKFPEHKKLAANMLSTMQRTKAGSQVLNFTLPDVDKNMVSLADFKGKWVYLSFIRVNDPNSQGEVETMAHFRDSIYARTSNVEFVTIVCDREFQKMYHFLKNNKHHNRYNWTWLHFNGDFDLLRNFRVVSYPTFVLINPDGKLQNDLAPAPSTGYLLHPDWQAKKTVEDTESNYFLNR